MNRKITTIPRFWWARSPVFIFYAAVVCGLAAGAIVLAYAPEFAAWYKGVML
jgi:hypothetical protein